MPLRQLDKQRVARRMAKVIVDALEVVDVEQGERDRSAPRQGCIEAGVEQGPAGQPGQRIVVDRPAQPFLGMLSGIDVGQGADHALGTAVGVA